MDGEFHRAAKAVQRAVLRRLGFAEVEDFVQGVMLDTWRAILRAAKLRAPIRSVTAMALRIGEARLASVLRAAMRRREVSMDLAYLAEQGATRAADLLAPGTRAHQIRFRGKCQRAILEIVLRGGTLEECQRVLARPRKAVVRILEGMCRQVWRAHRNPRPS